MNHYFEIRLKPDDEMSEPELVSKVYTKFHKLLCDLQTKQVAISFPEVSYKLGTLFRFHGPFDALTKIHENSWLGGLSGYCHVSEIKLIPKTAQYRTISGLRNKHNNARLRRMLSRGNLTREAIDNYRRKMLSYWLEQPYIDLKSQSTAQSYRKFFLFGKIEQIFIKGDFDKFGLSKVATIPWF